MEKIIRRRTNCGTSLPVLPVHPLLSRVYHARGIDSPEDLDLGLSRLIDPSQLLNGGRAATLLADAIAANLKMLIVGDFDADGATSTALALSALRQLGAAHVSYLVPNRFEYGYGLTPEIVELALGEQPDIIITVDNGISSLDGVAAASAAGIVTVITDHHLAGSELPDASVIVNPNQPGCPFPSKNLAGVGVIFYLMMALRSELRCRAWFESQGLKEPNLAQFLDLVALGTVADVVPLDRNNRVLVAAGLKRIRAGRARVGIVALLEMASRDPLSTVASDLGFAVAPRLNAAGRLDDMSIGIECLMCDEKSTAASYALQLDRLNKDRRIIENEMQQDALVALKGLQFEDTEPLPVALTLYQPDWHQGVIGILASRVKDRIHRPVIAFANGSDNQIKGSARSIAGIHIRDMLDAVATRHPGLISKFGGHAMAAGLSLAQADYADFSSAFVEEVGRHVEAGDMEAVIYTDGELEDRDYDLQVANELRFGGPWGQHFPEPLFDGRFTLVQQRLVGEKHLKLTVTPVNSTRLIDAIAFNVDLDRWPDESVEIVNLAYRLDINEFRGNTNLQLVVEYLSADGH